MNAATRTQEAHEVTVTVELDLRFGPPVEAEARVFWETGEDSPTVVWLSARVVRRTAGARTESHPFPVESLRCSGWEPKAIDAAYEAGLAERSAA